VKKSDMAESDFYTEFWMNSAEFWIKSAEFWKIGHHQISANLVEFVNSALSSTAPQVCYPLASFNIEQATSCHLS
jgi:hypothetical protein